MKNRIPNFEPYVDQYSFMMHPAWFVYRVFYHKGEQKKLIENTILNYDHIKLDDIQRIDTLKKWVAQAENVPVSELDGMPYTLLSEMYPDINKYGPLAKDVVSPLHTLVGLLTDADSSSIIHRINRKTSTNDYTQEALEAARAVLLLQPDLAKTLDTQAVQGWGIQSNSAVINTFTSEWFLLTILIGFATKHLIGETVSVYKKKFTYTQKHYDLLTAPYWEIVKATSVE